MLNITKWFGYAVAFIMMGLGVAVLLGIVPVRQIPFVRYLFGIVLFLIGIYRFIIAYTMGKSRGRKTQILPVFFLLWVGFSGCHSDKKAKPIEDTPTTGFLRVGVSEAYTSLMRLEAGDFMKLYPDAKIEILPLPTREAFFYLINDSLFAVITDRPLNEEERQVVLDSELKFQDVEIAKDALVVIVNVFNDLQNLPQETVDAILSGKITDWREIGGSGLTGLIRIALTGPNSGVYELLSRRFLAGKKVIYHVPCNTQNEVIQYVATHPLGIGIVSLVSLKDTSVFRVEKEKVRALDLFAPDSTGRPTLRRLHQANIYLGKYPLHYSVMMYVNPVRSRLSLGFSGFIASTPGQQNILNWGLVPATQPVRLIQLVTEPLEEM